MNYPTLSELATRLATAASHGTMSEETEKRVREVVADLTEMADAYEGFTRRMGNK